MTRVYSGVWPVLPTAFHENGTLDLDGNRRMIDCTIDQGVDGVCILANFSEQFLLADAEREQLTRLAIEHVDGRVPVIVTASHFSTDIVVARARQAAELGASMIMLMAPYHGALLKGSAEQTFEQFQRASEAGLPIMVQDAPLSGVELPVSLLARMAREIEQVKLFKIECAGAAAKLRALIEEAGAEIEGPFDGEEGITLIADLAAGATGNMSSALLPDKIGPIVRAYLAGERTVAETSYAAVLPLINHENRQCGFRGAKAVLQAAGVIRSDFCRHPIQPLEATTRATLLRLARELDLGVLRWNS